MILYIRCNCGRNKVLASKYKILGYEIRAINISQKWRQEAAKYKARVPFVVENGNITEL